MVCEEKLIKKLLTACGQAHLIENDLGNVESTDEITVSCMVVTLPKNNLKIHPYLGYI